MQFILLIGYQRELSYKHSDGSYSAFGESDPEGSMWYAFFHDVTDLKMDCASNIMYFAI